MAVLLFAAHVAAQSWKDYYDGDCVTFSVSSKENALQCKCKPQTDQLYGNVADKVKTYQHCLAGRVRGGLGAKTLSSMYAENICDGQPMPMYVYPDWNDATSMFVHWSEDADDWTTAASHIERVKFTASGAVVVSHLALKNCVHAGEITRGKDDKVAVLCGEVAGWENSLNLKVVEVEADLSKEVRRFSVLAPGCLATGSCQGAYPQMKGADFRLLTYIKSRNWYVAFFNAENGGHVADAMTVWDADTEQKVPGYGDAWACMGGHTETARMAYNAAADELAVLCCSDLGGTCGNPAKDNCDVDNQWKNGLVFRSHIGGPTGEKVKATTVAPFANVNNAAISGWLGDLLTCGDGFVQAWHGADGLADTFKSDTNDVGFMKLSAKGEVQMQKWVVKTSGTRERSVKLAKLGKGDCDRFLLGWGEMAADAYYPMKYYVVELDGEGNRLTEPLDVTDIAQWHEDVTWATLGNGDVAWANTWKRNDDGTPNHVGQKTDKSGAGASCTWNGNGYGYTWGTLDDRPGGRFHTNEAFTTRYIFSEAGETPTPATDVPATDVPQTDAPKTDVPDTDVPATTATDVPSTKAPATEVPATDAPATPVPVTTAPDTDVASTTAPATDVPATDAPVTTVPVTTAPDVPTTDAPATTVPVTTAPDTDVPTTKAPATDVPATDAAETDVPTTMASATDAPATPTDAPTTSAVTDMPTTAMTDVPQTEVPSTTAPITDAGTTAVPDTPATPVTPTPATPVDECAAMPCGDDQTCEDPNTDATSLNDFVCTCTDDKTVKATGSKATCTLDECEAKPCGDRQSCNDPNTKYGSQHDFVCTCDSDNSITQKDGPAVCSIDECESKPCGDSQSCVDSNPSPTSLKDYTCTCDDDKTVRATGAAVDFCVIDECEAKPCGDGQTCEDSSTKRNSKNDFTCTCDSDSATVKTGAAALCVVDECVPKPCGDVQMCTDADTKASATGGFECACSNGVKQTGGPATCTTGDSDECETDPCAGQACVDPDQSMGSVGDFVCTCKSGKGSATGKAAACVVDECEAAPCGAGQGCMDNSTAADSMGDFVCTCKAPASGMQTGAAVRSTSLSSRSLHGSWELR
eukprot:TRINITY_DN8683_c0_g1_i5.p1 TRINITY_DN8683_c0_g1~~TRINITY_DN8683_c0_g1_i5.p1  ORF type:complete len:1132 (+),score=360.30 TRINITY_DN8683_c0_g1_i5:120-3398(+)